MATPTPSQPYQGGNYASQAAQGGSGPQSGYSAERSGSQYVGATSNQQQFDKFCIIHVATTCDEHGVYVTKDSAEVIEIGWVVVDAREASLPEVCRGRACQA